MHLLSYTKQNNYPLLVKDICVSGSTVNILMMPSVSNHRYWIRPLNLFLYWHIWKICVVNKLMLQSSCIQDHMKIIGIDQSLFKFSTFKQKCTNNKKIHINMQISERTKKPSRISQMLLWCQLQRDSHITVLMFLWNKNLSIIQLIGNHCVFSPTYLMLKRKQQNIVLWLQNPNAKPWKWVKAFKPRKQN